MHRIYNKFLIVAAVALLIGSFYVYLSNNLNAQAASLLSTDSAISSQTGSSPAALLATNDKINVDTSFLSTLVSLTKIKIDTSIFTDKSFQALNDNTVNLETIAPGRENPFSPIQTVVQVDVAPLSPVVTNEATQVTNKTAVLNGTINNLSGITSVYFEYGITEDLGKVTPAVKQSLVGTFITNVTGLTPATSYFYRAVAKVGTGPVYGEILAFNTN